MARLGVYGGTFDPPHLGHLCLAESAADALDLEQVIFVPAGHPPHKRDAVRVPIQHRLSMLELAIANNQRFTISRHEIDRPGPHYTVETMRLFVEQQPHDEWYFIMGGDSLRDLDQWARPDELIRLCKLAVIARKNFDAAPAMHEAAIPGITERVTMIDSPLIAVSSTGITERLLEGRSVRYLVPDAVLSYIKQYGLYR